MLRGDDPPQQDQSFIIHHIEGFQFVWKKKEPGEIHPPLKPAPADPTEDMDSQKRGHQTMTLPKEFFEAIPFIPQLSTQTARCRVFSILFKTARKKYWTNNSTKSLSTSTPPKISR